MNVERTERTLARRTVLLVLMIGGVAACGTMNSRGPTPWRDPTSEAEIVAILAKRTGVESFQMLATVAWSDSRGHSAFKALVQFKAPGQLRVTAFTEVAAVGTQSVFDVLIAPAGCALEIASRDGVPGERDFGSAADMAERHPAFAGLVWAREALFLPGVATAPPPLPSFFGPRPKLVHFLVGTGPFVGGPLPSGAPVVWTLNARLDVESGQILLSQMRWSTSDGPPPPYSGDTRGITFDYSDLRHVNGFTLPGAIDYADPAAKIKMAIRVLDLVVNPDLDDALFLPESVGARAR